MSHKSNPERFCAVGHRRSPAADTNSKDLLVSPKIVELGEAEAARLDLFGYA